MALQGLEKKELDPYASNRTQRAIEDIASYNVQIKHIPKASNRMADFMSRKLHSTQDAPEVPRHLPVSMVAVMFQGVMLDKRLLDLVEKANDDPTYQDVIECLHSKQLLTLLDKDHPAQQYKRVWKDLSITQVPNGRVVLFQGTRVVPPDTLIPEIGRAHV